MSWYFGKRHLEKDFDKPFPYPECKRLYVGENFMITSVEVWKIYTSEVYGIDALRSVLIMTNLLVRAEKLWKTKANVAR